MFCAKATALLIGAGSGPKSMSVVRLARPFQQPTILAASSRVISCSSLAREPCKGPATASFATHRIITL